MGNAKNGSPAVASYDFYKTNGTSSDDHAFFTEGPSLTRQEFAAECDINTIMAQYDSHLADPMRSVREPRYYDFTAMPGSLMEAMDVMRRGEEAFMSLPAVVRREFDNDAAQFVDFAADPANLPQMQTWGLAPKPPEPNATAPIASAPSASPGATPGGAVAAGGAPPAAS